MFIEPAWGVEDTKQLFNWTPRFPEELPPLLETYYIGTRCLGSKAKYWFRTNGGVPALAGGYTFFCPRCNEIWARRIVSSPASPEHASWRELLPQIVTRRCERHAYAGDGESGSLVLSEYEWSHLVDDRYHYPLEWMAYELFLTIRRDYSNV